MNLLPILVFIQYHLVIGQLSFDPEELKHKCLNGIYHKKAPGPEDDLHNQCTPWKDHTCCTYKNSLKLHDSDDSRYNFNRAHCKKLSEECERHFVQDMCFYECDPNLGPWLVKVDMKVRKERFIHVPLCASDCDQWFKSCQNDLTCAENWIRGFRRENGTNVCSKENTCRTFKEVYQNAQNFCEKVWDYSWKYTPDDQPCMRIWFDGSAGNPNVRVAEIRINELISEWNSSTNVGEHKISSSSSLLILLFLTMCFYIHNS